MVNDALPLYIQIADKLRQDISSSVYQKGDQLPTEADLSVRFGVNRHTLRRAIEVLRTEGLIRVDRGRGMFVASTSITYPLSKRVRYNDVLKAQGLQVSHKILAIITIPADSKIVKRLALEANTPVVLFERLAFADEHPISVSSSYFPSSLFPGLPQHCEQYHSISKLLQQEYGCEHIRQSTRISARTVQPKDARLLELPAGAPILLTESINIDQMGRRIEYGVTRFRGDRMELVIENDSA
jgi:GntR family phosphonate transport system transcriptional regulator